MLICIARPIKHCARIKFDCFTRKYASIVDIHSRCKVNDEITVTGWVKSLRKLKENVFIDLNDGSCNQHLQVLIAASQKPNNLSTGASIVTKGILNKTPKGHLELQANDIKVIGSCNIADGYPFAPRKTYPPEYIRQHLHFRSRTNRFSSLLRVRNAATKAFHDYFNEKGYFNIHTPILTSNDCEGAGEVFKVCPNNKNLLQNMAKKGLTDDEAYFNTKVYLTVSGQLHLEAISHGLSNVYTFGPTFRAENSKSRLHLSEFYMIEAEKAFVNDLEEITDFIENMIKSVTKIILDKCSGDMKRLSESTEQNFMWLEKKFIVMSFAEAVDIFKKTSLSTIEKEGLSKEHELCLVNYCDGVPVFLVNWPAFMKPFYAKECKNNSQKVEAVDLLVGNVGELVGGSLREDDYHKLKSKLPSENTDLSWYLELKKFGGAPTGGFGLGFERYLQFILSISNIKDTIPFPRWPHNCQL